jgi:hypothetical protein
LIAIEDKSKSNMYKKDLSILIDKNHGASICLLAWNLFSGDFDGIFGFMRIWGGDWINELNIDRKTTI